MSLPRPSSLRVSRRWLCLAGACAGVSGCGLKPEDGPDQPGAAFTDSQIPPGLSPDDYPPAGFVWSGFKFGTLPEARYGVAAPPLNPRAHLLILADARYPAEVYFSLARTALEANISVWILEPPGQGGAGRYLLQGDEVFVPDYRHALRVTQAFVEQIVRPTPDKPLYVFAHGSGAVTAALCDGHKWPLLGMILYAPLNGGKVASPAKWQGADQPADSWGRRAQRWRMANPDLRRVHLSETWQTQMSNAHKALGGFRLSGHMAPTDSRLLITGTEGDLKSYCTGYKDCQTLRVTDESALQPVFAVFISER